MDLSWWLMVSLFFFIVLISRDILLYRARVYALSWRLPGPFALPIFGNAFIFLCKDEDIFERAVDVISRYSSPMRFWFGPKFSIIFTDAEQAAKILTSTNFITKDDVYRFMAIFNGEGLISGSGPKWKRDRKVMAPLFLKKNVTGYFSTILHHTKILVDTILESKVNGPAFNIEKYLHRCAADFVNESILGVETNAQSGDLDSFLEAVDRMYGLVHARIVKVWLQVEWIFKMTHYSQLQEHGKALITKFMKKYLNSAEIKRAHKTDQGEHGTLLNKILDIRDDIPDFATEEQLIHHLTTLYTASEDPVTTISAFTLLLLGMYPEIQSKILTEIDAVLGDKNDIELEDLAKFFYLDMCVKDVLRLFPIAPFIMRVATKDFPLDQWNIPKGCSVIVSIHNIHRSPQYWEKPNEFYPEHFLPEAVDRRHPYAYLPFSAGPRGCLGKPYASMSLNIILVTILRKYRIEADGSLKDIPLKTDISVRKKDKQYPIRIYLRKSLQ